MLLHSERRRQKNINMEYSTLLLKEKTIRSIMPKYILASILVFVILNLKSFAVSCVPIKNKAGMQNILILYVHSCMHNLGKLDFCCCLQYYKHFIRCTTGSSYSSGDEESLLGCDATYIQLLTIQRQLPPQSSWSSLSKSYMSSEDGSKSSKMSETTYQSTQHHIQMTCLFILWYVIINYYIS
jgi:hypothetical protein